ncbi:hypothetical protein EI94DRAFT_263494 [Lactarius quietus]|nr:hypothetical protein EI94DRAFT_263494 [Lactarius quietus]
MSTHAGSGPPPTPFMKTNLADIVKSSDDGLLAIYEGSMTVIGIFVGIQGPLLFYFLNDSNFQKSGSVAKQTLLALALCGLFLSLSAAVAGLILTNELGKTPTPQQLSDGETPDTSRGYEGRAWVKWHWIFSLAAGIVLPVTQVLVYVWLEESNFVKITLSIITVFSVLPSLYLIPLFMATANPTATFTLDSHRGPIHLSFLFFWLKPQPTRVRGCTPCVFRT